MKKEKISCIPDPSMWEKMRQPYSLAEALAELVDNSLAARQDNKQCQIDIVVNANKITVTDNGSGMPLSKVKEAMTMGLSNWDTKDGLGGFGVGLKQAGISLGRMLTIITTGLGDTNKYTVSMDATNFTTWTADMVTEGAEADTHGTTVVIEKLRMYHGDYAIQRLIADFSRRYAPFILKNNVSIRVGSAKNNLTKCIASVTEIVKGTVVNFETTIDGHKIHGYYAIAANPTTKTSGFDLYRRGRLICNYVKLGYNWHPDFNAITGEIHLDHMPVATNKREFMRESTEWQAFMRFWGSKEDRMPGLIDKITKSTQSYASAKAKEISSVDQQRILNAIKVGIQNDERYAQFGHTAGGILMGKTYVMRRKHRANTNTPSRPAPDPNRVIKRRCFATKIKIGNRWLSFQILFSDGIDANVSAAHTPGQIYDVDIVINTRYPGYKMCKDTVYYVTRETVEQLAIFVGGHTQYGYQLRDESFSTIANVLTEQTHTKKTKIKKAA